MTSLRWLGAVAAGALIAVGPAWATEGSPGDPEAAVTDPTVQEAPTGDSTRAEAPGASATDPVEEPSAPEQSDEAEPATPEPVQIRGASVGGPAQQALETAAGALAKQVGSAEAGEKPLGAVPSLKESLQVGDALDDMLLFPEPYYYQSVGRRDIFVSLLEEKEGGDPSLRSGELTVVGILWAERARFALVETPEGRALILREGAALGDGTVVRILPDRVIVHVTEYGTSRNVSLPLAQGGLNDENPRSRSR